MAEFPHSMVVGITQINQIHQTLKDHLIPLLSPQYLGIHDVNQWRKLTAREQRLMRRRLSAHLLMQWFDITKMPRP